MINAETLETLERERERERERESHILPKMALVWQPYTSNSIENKKGNNTFIYHTRQTDYIL